MATRLVKVLLLAYPPSLRHAHGDEIAFAVSERWREARGVATRGRVLWDLVVDFFASWPRAWRGASPRQVSFRPPADRSPFGSLAFDVRAAVRLLRHAPLFAAGAIATLALGIGATTAVVSLANATLLHPLPIPDPSRVIQEKFSWSYPDFRDAASLQRVFSSMTAWATPPVAIENHGTMSQICAAGVSGSYFSLAGQHAVAGRLLDDRDDRPGAPPVAVMSDRLWRGAFGGEPILGMAVLVNQRPVTVVGIAPTAFRGLSLQVAPDLFVPLASLSTLTTGFLSRPGILTNRGAIWLQVAGRLDDGVTEAQADAELSAIYRRFHPVPPGTKPDGIESTPILARAIGLDGADDLRRFLWVLAGATCVTLLLTCATVANLLLLRAERRRRELAVHAALGAGRGRLARLLFVESLAIGLTGGIVALGVALAALRLLATFAVPGQIVIGDLGLTPNLAMFSFAVTLGLATSLIFGVAPIWQLRRLDLMATLRDGSRTTDRQPLRVILVGLQVSLCVLLLGGSLAFGRALEFALNLDLGFDDTHTTLTAVSPGLVRYPTTRVAALHRDILEAVRARPDVRAAAWSSLRPLSGGMRILLSVAGYQPAQGESMTVDGNVVSDGYFQAMGLRVLAGRPFTAGDTRTAPLAAVVSVSLAEKYWPHGAIGRQAAAGLGPGPDTPATIVGVVSDVHRTVNGPAVPMIYLAEAQNPQIFDVGGQYLVTATTRDPRNVARDLVATLQRVDPMVPVTSSGTMHEYVESTVAATRLGLTLFAAFAALAMILTGLGLHAVVAYAVSHRAREFGVRVALGAAPSAVVALVVRQGLAPVAAGLACGIAAFIVSASTLRQFMFGLPPSRPAELAVVAAAVGLLALTAMILPARRALRIDPALALRND